MEVGFITLQFFAWVVILISAKIITIFGGVIGKHQTQGSKNITSISYLSREYDNLDQSF